MRRALTWTMLLAFAACGGKPAQKGGEAAAGGDGGPTASGAPRPAPLTPKKLSPVIQAIGAEGVVPAAVTIELATPIVEPSAVGKVSAKSVLKLTPEVAGTLTHSGVSTLTFTPARGFDFETTYKVELLKIDTRDGVIAPPEGERWAYELTTPAFAFLGWAPTSIDLDKKRLLFDLTFSGPVLAASAKPFVAVTVNGKPAASLTLNRTGEPNVLQATVADPRIALGATLRLAIKKNLPAQSGARAVAASAEHVVSKDKAIAIKAALLKEGTQGFYLEVICDDKAAPPGERSFYDEDANFYGLSSRCELRDDAAARIAFKPQVKGVYLTPGKAGFRVFGDFKRGNLSMTIPGGVASVDGGVLMGKYVRSFSVPARKAQIAFAASGRYLPRSAWKELGVRHLNVEAANLTVRQVPPENLVFWLGADASEDADERTSNKILEKTIPLRGENDAVNTSWIDVASLLPPTTRGVLELKLAAVGASATARLLVTDLSLVAKKSAPAKEPWNQEVQVWALGIESSALLDGVEVSLVRKSGKVVARCSTAGAQGCLLHAAADDADRSEPFAVIARKGDDLTYIRYRDLRTQAAEASVSGEPFELEAAYRAALWADRGVYRPGDTAHVVAVVRDRKDVAPAAPLPVEIKLVDPRAKVVKRLLAKTNEAGMVSLDHSFAAFADTGHYRVEMAVADKSIATLGLQVEEFVPERMKATVVPIKPDILAGDDASFVVDARYLFGGGAGGSEVTLTCRVEPTGFEPEANDDYTYGVEVPDKVKAVTLGEEKGKLDDAGHAALDCPELEGELGRTAELTGQLAVLEAGSGRSTVRNATITVHPERFYLGLKTQATRASAGKPFSVSGLVVDWKGAPLSAAVKEVTVETLHLEAEYDYGYQGEEGESSYRRNVHAVPEGKSKVAVEGGRFKLDVTPADASAGYRVRVSAGRAVTELTLDGDYPYYAEDEEGGGGGGADQTPRPARPTQLKLDTPREVKVGEPLAVKLMAPYRGKLLFTVETDRLVASEWKDVQAGEVTWSWKPTTYAPNVYVSAFLIKDPHLESAQAFLPDRAFGVVPVRIAPTEMTQTVELDVPKEIRSSSPLAVKLALGPVDAPTYVTVAVVDEGILSLTGFRTPDPLGSLTARRALGVDTYETIGWTQLHAPAGPSSRTGGDGEEEEAGGLAGETRVQPVKPVALFSGLVKVDASGKATIPFQIPAYRGELRVMAFSASAKRIGRAEARVTVKDPLVAQVTFPRFSTMGDEMQIPVFLTNLSGGDLDVEVSLAGETLPVPGMVAPPTGSAAPAPLTFLGQKSGSVRLEDGKSYTLVFQVKSAVPVGAAKLRVTAVGKGGKATVEAHDEVDVPLLPAGPRERLVQKVKLEAGTVDLAPLLRGWVPTSERTTFWMTSNPYGESFDHLKHLIHYPYGCIEQTTSSTRPLLFVSNLIDKVDPQVSQASIDDMVMAGINRVFSMQTASGGLGYWPGDDQPVDWGTAYATHMLLDAKKLGYPVPEDRLADIVRYIESRLTQYERDQRQDARRYYRYDDESEAYLHYVLALAGQGKARKARIAALIADLPPQPSAKRAEEAYMLKAALYVAGDRRYEKDLKSPDASPIVEDRSNDWSFYSDRRRRGFMLATFVDLFGKSPEAEPLAQRVASSLAERPSYYYSTQELVWGITGLGKWVEGPADFEPGKLIAGGKILEPRPTKSKGPDRMWALARASEVPQLSLAVPGKGPGSLWLVVSSDGVREKPDEKVGGNGLKVTRRYRTLSGDAVDLENGSVKLGDLIFVDIEIGNTSGETVRNIALVDRLAAGLEIENPRLGRDGRAEWIEEDSLWAMDYLNLRDDRLEAFGALAPGAEKRIVYTVRAVTSGKYTLPPVEAEAMYDPSLWAREKGKTIVITGPWTGHLI